MSSNNPFNVGDTLSIKRGEGWISGVVVKTVLARCHIKIDGKVFVEDWHKCQVEEQRDWDRGVYASDFGPEGML